MNRDLAHLGKLQDYYAKHGVLPPYSGLANLVGMKSKGAVYKMLRRLAAAGYVATMPDKRIQPTERFFERVLLDSVPAGMPRSANDIPAESFNIDDYLINAPSRTVILTVQGDSMIEAGLMPGDRIIVKRGAPPKVGDIVVAIVDGEYTVKYLAMDMQRYYLRPANPAYPDIHAQDHLEIYGLVIGSFRKY